MQEALQELVDKLHGWFIELVTLLPNIFIAMIVILVAFVVARLVSNGVQQGMRRVTDYPTLNRLAATLGRLVVIAAGVFVALAIIGLDSVVVTVLAGAGIVGLAIAFAFQDLTANFISGILLTIRRPFRQGDFIETNGYEGVLHELNLRSTHVRTPQGQIVIVPNKEVLENPLVNYTRLGRRRVDLACGVAYGDDLEEAEQVALEAIRSISTLAEAQPVDVYYTEFGDSSVDFVIRFWIDSVNPLDFLAARSEGIKRLKRAFDEAGLTIPFPIRTLDFGVVGGEKLSEMWPRDGNMAAR